MEATTVAEIELREAEAAKSARRAKAQRLFAPGTVRPALKQAFVMLRPDIQWSNPVMFVVEVGAFLTLLFVIQAAIGHSSSWCPRRISSRSTRGSSDGALREFRHGLAEARGKAQAESLRKTRRDTVAYRVRGTTVEQVSSTTLKPGDRVVVEAGQVIPGDGEIVEESRRWTNPPSPANRRRSSARRAEIAPASPAARPFCRIAS
jgi:K+-transporting ATPase ATPase B chain